MSLKSFTLKLSAGCCFGDDGPARTVSLSSPSPSSSSSAYGEPGDGERDSQSRSTEDGMECDECERGEEAAYAAYDASCDCADVTVTT